VDGVVEVVLVAVVILMFVVAHTKNSSGSVLASINFQV
jgi:hypothetical protein